MRVMLVVLISLTACGPRQATTGDFPDICSAAYPSGILSGQTPEFSVAYQVTASYELEDPNFTHAATPELFTPALNAAAAGTGTTFINADGTAGNLGIELALLTDDTDDHYGMSVAVIGTETMFIGASTGTSPAVTLFSAYFAPLYISAETLINDVTAKIAQHIVRGWTCDANDVSVPN